MFWHWEHVSESFLDEGDVLVMVNNSGSNDEALLWGDVIHDEFLKHSGVNVINVLCESESWHTESVVTVCSSEEHLLGVSKWIELGQMVVEIVGLSVLGSSNVSSQSGSWLKGDIDHHLEHVDNIVLNALSLEVDSLLVVIHGHVSTGHLDHAVVDGLVGVLQGLEVGVLQGQESSGGFGGLVSGSDIDQEAHLNGSREDLAFCEHSESVVQVCNLVTWHLVLGLNGFLTLLSVWLHWVVSGNLVGLGAGVHSVENSVQDTWVGSLGKSSSLS